MKKLKITNNRSMSTEVIATPAVTTTVLYRNAEEFKFYKGC